MVLKVEGIASLLTTQDGSLNSAQALIRSEADSSLSFDQYVFHYAISVEAKFIKAKSVMECRVS